MAGDVRLGLTAEQVQAAYEETGNVSATARRLGCSRSTVHYHLRRGGAAKKPISGGRVRAQRVPLEELPAPGQVRRWILTSAQNNTHVHRPTWENLLALAKHYDAEVKVATFTYNKNAYGKLSVKRGTDGAGEQTLWYDPDIEPYIDDSNLELAPGLMWCGRMNTLPTDTDPLSGFETYTGRKSGIFPHAKHAARSIPSSKHEDTKFNYTTGTVTQLNYLQKRAGLKAEHHHTYGAVLVEVDSEGTWFVRQLQNDPKNRLYDLDVMVEGGRVQKAKASVEAITWGDVHAERCDPTVRALAWGKGGILDSLKPKFQFVHDLIDFNVRNHHTRNDPHHRFRHWAQGEEEVEGEMHVAVELLKEMSRKWTRVVVVNSNHDNALTQWLKECDYRTDPANAMFFLECQLEVYRSIKKGDGNFMILEHVLRNRGCPQDVRFLHTDEAFIICSDSRGGIDCGAHGHLGPNGARGSARSLAKQGRRQNIGHSLIAGIFDGLYQAGTFSLMDMGYNLGPSSWSHTVIVTYPNGKRTLVTIFDGKWRA